MKVYLNNKVPLADYKGEEVLELPEGTQIRELMHKYDVTQHLVFVNNAFVAPEYVLSENDNITFLAVTSGG